MIAAVSVARSSGELLRERGAVDGRSGARIDELRRRRWRRRRGAAITDRAEPAHARQPIGEPDVEEAVGGGRRDGRLEQRVELRIADAKTGGAEEAEARVESRVGTALS